MSMSLKKVGEDKAQEITQHFEFIDEFQPVVDDEQAPADFLQTLIDNEHYQDAVTFLAHAIGPKEAVWWSCVCARHHIDDFDEKLQAGLKTAEAWVYENSEENRRLCEKHAEELDYTGVTAWACAAAFWSGGSIGKPDEPAIEVLPYIYAHAAAGSIISAVGFGETDEDTVKERYEEYIKHGISIADGGNG